MTSGSTGLQALSAGDIWAAERPVWFGGVRLRSRMTVFRAGDGRLWVHSPAEPTAELCAELDRLGEVAWIILPNRFHHLQAPAMKARYPRALVVGPLSVKARNGEVVLDRVIDDTELSALFPDFTSVALKGVPFLDETLFLHRKTGTLIGADLMMCGCGADHFTWRWASRLLGQYQKYRAPPDVRWNTKRTDEVRQSITELAKLPIERILVAHSDPVEDRPVEELKEAWSFVV
ncbi:MAG: DUF4336 domain-containing protein [Polyangiaceae bacterium]